MHTSPIARHCSQPPRCRTCSYDVFHSSELAVPSAPRFLSLLKQSRRVLRRDVCWRYGRSRLSRPKLVSVVWPRPEFRFPSPARGIHFRDYPNPTVALETHVITFKNRYTSIRVQTDGRLHINIWINEFTNKEDYFSYIISKVTDMKVRTSEFSNKSITLLILVQFIPFEVQAIKIHGFV